MRKQLPGVCVVAGIMLLAACTSDDGQQQNTVAPQPAVCNGPVVEISGADPRLNRSTRPLIRITSETVRATR